MSQTNPEELTGWKQIADYLRVSIRTAQKLEKEQGLPLRRGAGQKGPVFASIVELDEWRTKAKSNQADSVAPVLPTPPPSRRIWLWYALTAGPTALASVTAAALKLHSAKQRLPASCHANGNALVLYGPDGSEIGRYSFPEPGKASPCTFLDLDGRGRDSALFEYTPAMPFSGNRLACVRADGTRRWEFTPGRAVTDDRGRQFSPPFSPGPIALFRPHGSKRDQIAVSSPHCYSFPNQLAILDSQTGKVVSEYWHRGHLNFLRVADLDGDGEPEILASGVNDAPEYKQATLLVFDHRRLSGATPHPRGGSYFQGIPPVPAKHTIFFPKTPVGQREEFNRAWAIGVHPERLVVQVVEGVSLDSPHVVIYEFDYTLRARNVTLSDTLQNRLIEMQDRGEAPREPAVETAERLKREVVVV